MVTPVKAVLSALINNVKTPVNIATSPEQVLFADGATLVQVLAELRAMLGGATVTKIVQTIAARDALPDVANGWQVWVIDASGDPKVTRGGAKYLYSAALVDGSHWIKTGEAESMDLILQWAAIQGIPQVLRDLGVDANGRLTLSGQPVSDGLVDVAIIESGGAVPANLRPGGLIIERV